MSCKVVLLALFVVACLVPTAAFPNGAGACPVNQTAVEGSHLTRTSVISGTLQDGDFTLTLDAIELSSATNFTVGENHTLTLTSTTSDFTGFLFRLGGPFNTVGALDIPSGASDIQLADICHTDGAAGVTHVNSDTKTVVSAVLRLGDAASNLPLDVTVVVSNSGSTSIWYYSGYTLNAVTAAAATPTATPAGSPSAAPATPTATPAGSPSAAPATPTASPAGSPSAAPATPTASPAGSPSAAPAASTSLPPTTKNSTSTSGAERADGKLTLVVSGLFALALASM